MTQAITPVSLAQLQGRSSALLSCPAWGELARHAQEQGRNHLRVLLDEPGRYHQLVRTAGGLRVDFSRQRLTTQTLPVLIQLAEERGLPDWINHLFAGAAVNSSERRPALHMALRDHSGRAIVVQGEDIMPLVRRERARVLAFADAIGSGEYRGHTGKSITDVVNIGIGGSDLGLVMAVEALRPYRNPTVRTHFVSNIDGTQLADTLELLDPAQTLFIICSKSFTTLETQLNAEAARSWLLERLPEAALARHVVAVSVNDAAMDKFGIHAANRYRIWDWVGGRYSLWSSVGLAIAIALGSRHFEGMLNGAFAMDEHFRTTRISENVPALLGLIGVWNQNFLGASSHVILPYTQRLHRLPAFLQQLEMESNGKAVTRDGKPVAWSTGTIIWGEPGSNAQHAFFQLLHQGNAVFSADFIAPARPSRGPRDQHLAGLTNMVAQAEAFARGRTEAEVLAELTATGMPVAEARALAPHKIHPGNRPSTIMLMDQLDPGSLGALVAAYEHKVFVQSVVWGINPFDQWGVELGKVLAKKLGDVLINGNAQVGLPDVIADIRRAQS